MVDFDIESELDQLDKQLRALVSDYRECLKRRNLLRRRAEHPEEPKPVESIRQLLLH